MITEELSNFEAKDSAATSICYLILSTAKLNLSLVTP
jgi:hypothetical protein